MRSLWWWVRGRRDGVGEGDVAIPYAGGSTAFGLAMVAVTVVEIVAIELVLPWPVLRWVIAVLSVVSLLLLLRMTADAVVRPHVLTGESIRLRGGCGVDVTIPLAAVQRVTLRRREAPRATVHEGVAVLPHGNETQLELTTKPVAVEIGRQSSTVTTVRISADEPTAARRAITTRLPNHTANSS